jgi:NAD(P)-dependent dehydrogenase (short-subunit alcohol dehydrogenase family)
MSTSRNCIILGKKSDIVQGLLPLLEADGWIIDRGVKWDLIICAYGRIAPVGLWHDNNYRLWEDSIESNLLKPIRELRFLWPRHNPNASICFLAGSNPNTIMDGYSAYNVGKMALLKAVEQMDHETPDAKFFALGPGTILTKIHKASEGWSNPKLEAARKQGEDRQEKIQRVYDCLKWCMAQAKEVVGGRNICASDELGTELAVRLRRHDSMYKLRRQE